MFAQKPELSSKLSKRVHPSDFREKAVRKESEHKRDFFFYYVPSVRFLKAPKKQVYVPFFFLFSFGWRLSHFSVRRFVAQSDKLCLSICLPYIVPTLTSRLAVQEVVEPSEELRLVLVEFLSKLVSLSLEKEQAPSLADTAESCHDDNGALLFPYLDDVCNILQRTIVDPYPEVKKVILDQFLSFFFSDFHHRTLWICQIVNTHHLKIAFFF